MVKYIVDHTNVHLIGSDVDEIIIGSKECETKVFERINQKHMKYVSTISLMNNYLYMKLSEQYPDLHPKVVIIGDGLAPNEHTLGIGMTGMSSTKSVYKYEIRMYDDELALSFRKFQEFDRIFMMSCEVYRAYVNKYPTFCSKALEEYEKEYFDKRSICQYQSDYDLSFIYN